MYAVWDKGRVRFESEQSYTPATVSWSACTEPGGDFRGICEPAVDAIVFIRLQDDDESPPWEPPLPSERISVQL